MNEIFKKREAWKLSTPAYPFGNLENLVIWLFRLAPHRNRIGGENFLQRLADIRFG
jgi:hypothetical protein